MLFKHEGNQTIYSNQNGVSGDLIVKVNIVKSDKIERDGDNVFSKHFITLGEAVRGKSLQIPTIKEI